MNNIILKINGTLYVQYSLGYNAHNTSKHVCWGGQQSKHPLEFKHILSVIV